MLRYLEALPGILYFQFCHNSLLFQWKSIMLLGYLKLMLSLILFYLCISLLDKEAGTGTPFIFNFFLIFNIYLFLRERERESAQVREGQRERETQNPK